MGSEQDDLLRMQIRGDAPGNFVEGLLCQHDRPQVTPANEVAKFILSAPNLPYRRFSRGVFSIGGFFPQMPKGSRQAQFRAATR